MEIFSSKKIIFVSVVLSLLLFLSGVFFSGTARAQEDPLVQIGQMAEKFKDKMLDASKTVGVGAKTKIKAIIKLLDVVKDKKEWTEPLWNEVIRIAEETGIAVDELVPSVSGCITDEAENPVYGTLIAVLPITVDVAIPTYAMTGGGAIGNPNGIPSTFGFGASGPVIPVSETFVPASYRETFNKGGCYWVPLSPGVINTLGSLISLPGLANTNDKTGEINKTFTTADVKIIPVKFGYTIDPVAKEVQFNKDGSFYTMDIETPGGFGTLGSMQSDSSK